MTDLTLETELNRQRNYLETKVTSLLTQRKTTFSISQKIKAEKVDLEKVDFDLYECIEGSLKAWALRADE